MAGSPMGKGAPLGNQNARKAKVWEQAIKRALARRNPERSVDRGLDDLADKLVAAAEVGDSWAIKEIGDRIDGKAAQAVAVTGEDGGPIQTQGLAPIYGLLPPS